MDNEDIWHEWVAWVAEGGGEGPQLEGTWGRHVRDVLSKVDTITKGTCDVITSK